MNTITKLAVGNIKTKRSQSILISFSIFLTAMLLSAIMSCTYGTIKSNIANVGKMAGDYWGAFLKITQQQADRMEIHSQFQSIGLGSGGSVVDVENTQADIDFRYLDEISREFLKVEAVEGSMPQKENEAAGPKRMFELLGVKNPKIGDEVTIPVRIEGKGKIFTENFVISGFLMEQGEVFKKSCRGYVSKDYFYKRIPEDKRKYNAYFLVDNQENLNSDEMELKIYALGEELGVEKSRVQVNRDYLMWILNPPFESILVMLVVSLLVILFSTVVIYNIFHVGMTKRLQDYGKIKSLGATKKQLKKLVFTEGLLLGGIAVPTGLFAGYGLIAKFLFEQVLIKSFYQRIQVEITEVSFFHPLLLLTAGALSFLTIFLALCKPMKMVSKIPPAEAVRYQEGKNRNHGIRKKRGKMNVCSLLLADISANRKRNIATILTMGLSCVLYVAAANLISNISQEYAAREEVRKGDFVLWLDADYHDDTYTENNLNEVQKKNLFGEAFLSEIKKIEGVEAVETENAMLVKVENTQAAEEELYQKIGVLTEPEFDVLKQKLKEGEADYLEAAAQNGVFYMYGSQFAKELGLKTGQRLEFTVLDGDRRIPLSTVLEGICFWPGANFYMTEDTFQSLGVTENMTDTIFVYCEKKNLKKVQEELTQLINGERFIKMESYEEVYQSYQQSYQIIKYIMYTIILVIGLIGFLNMASTMVTSIITRKQEFGILQAVGMTNKQLNAMLWLEGILFTAGTLFVALTAGNICGYLIYLRCRAIGMTGIGPYRFPWLEMAVMCGSVLLLQLALSCLLSGNVKKESLIERIRYQG